MKIKLFTYHVNVIQWTALENLSNLMTSVHWKLDGTCADLRLARAMLGGSTMFPPLAPLIKQQR